MGLERYVIGESADIEAEYGQASDARVTILTLVDGTVLAVEGFEDFEAAKEDLADVPAAQILFL